MCYLEQDGTGNPQCHGERNDCKKGIIARLPAGCLENKDPTHAAAIKQLLLGQIQTVLCNCSLDLFQMNKHFFLCVSRRCARVQRGYKEQALILCNSGLGMAKT